MYESPERLNQVLARWWQKVLATECHDPECPDMSEDWAFWEETDASLREALQSEEGENQKAPIREAA
jgi:hypothetical protein